MSCSVIQPPSDQYRVKDRFPPGVHRLLGRFPYEGLRCRLLAMAPHIVDDLMHANDRFPPPIQRLLRIDRLSGLFESQDVGGIHAGRRQVSPFTDEGFRRKLLAIAANMIEDVLQALVSDRASDLNRQKDRFPQGVQGLIGFFQSPHGGKIIVRRRPGSNEDEVGEDGGGQLSMAELLSAIMCIMRELGSDRASDEEEDDDDDDDDRRGRREPDPEREVDLEGLNVRGISWWCHQCDLSVNPCDEYEDIFCPHCHCGFIEEIEDRGWPRWNEDEDGRPVGASLRVVTRYPTNLDLIHDNDELHTRQERERDLDGPNVTPVLDQGETGRVEQNGLSVGNTVLRMWLFQLIQQLQRRLAENNPTSDGTPPAAKTAVDALPTVHISEEHLRSDCSQCVICKEEFELGAEIRQMPCTHLYHSDCILAWLMLHSCCPICRFQLPSEDHDDTSGNNCSSSSSSTQNSPQITHRISNNNDNEASSSNSNDIVARSSSNVAPSLLHSHSDDLDGPESGGC